VTADYDGASVLDSSGEPLGTVERTYVDDSNAARFVEVKIGTLFAKHRLIPVDDATQDDDGALHVPFDKQTIENSPEPAGGDALEPADLEALQQFYGVAGGGDEDGGAESPSSESDLAVSDADAPPSEEAIDSNEQESVTQGAIIDETARGLRVGDEVPGGLTAPIRDDGDVVEVPVLEDVLVKKTVVREILRVKKTDLVEQQTVSGDVRKEDIDVSDPAGVVSDADDDQ
jgi:hypothetical protein